MDHAIPTHLPATLFHALAKFTGEGWFGPKTEAALAAAVRDWLERQQDDGRAPRPEAEPTPPSEPRAQSDAATGAPSPTATGQQGYQWKQLFLPDGTLLRVTIGPDTTYAQVEGNALRADGKRSTPSRFANAGGGAVRNAWRVIWLRFPGDTRWRRAAACR
jgi:hypothetical protein